MLCICRRRLPRGAGPQHRVAVRGAAAERGAQRPILIFLTASLIVIFVITAHMQEAAARKARSRSIVSAAVGRLRGAAVGAAFSGWRDASSSRARLHEISHKVQDALPAHAAHCRFL